MAALSRSPAPKPLLAASSATGLAGFAVAITLAALSIAVNAWSQESLEIAVKAAYLYKFAPFITWRANSLTPSDPFTICIVGSDPFGSVLDRAAANQRVDGRLILVLRMVKADRKSPCQIMYIGGSPARVRETLQAVSGAPILTVTDSPTAPGVVDFVIDQGRVRFRLDDEAAADDGLTISSKLLSLAVSVKPRKSVGGAR